MVEKNTCHRRATWIMNLSGNHKSYVKVNPTTVGKEKTLNTATARCKSAKDTHQNLRPHHPSVITRPQPELHNGATGPTPCVKSSLSPLKAHDTTFAFLAEILPITSGGTRRPSCYRPSPTRLTKVFGKAGCLHQLTRRTYTSIPPNAVTKILHFTQNARHVTKKPIVYALKRRGQRRNYYTQSYQLLALWPIYHCSPLSSDRDVNERVCGTRCKSPAVPNASFDSKAKNKQKKKTRHRPWYPMQSRSNQVIPHLPCTMSDQTPPRQSCWLRDRGEHSRTQRSTQICPPAFGHRKQKSHKMPATSLSRMLFAEHVVQPRYGSYISFR